jgi:ATP-binding cassette subfamily B protein
LSFSYFDKTNSGWLIARMNNDTSSHRRRPFLGYHLDVLGLIRYASSPSSRCSPITGSFRSIVCASIPVVAIIVPIFERSLLKRWRTARNAYSRFVGWLAEAINGSKTIKTLSIEDEVSDEAKGIVDDIKETLEGRADERLLPAACVLHLDDHDRHRRESASR